MENVRSERFCERLGDVGCLPEADIAALRAKVSNGPMVLQKSQKSLGLISRQRTKQAKIVVECGLKPPAGIACESVGAWSRTSLFKRRAYGFENLSPDRQKDFCNTIGHKPVITPTRRLTR